MFRKRKPFKNQLSDDCSQGKLSLEQAILSKELAVTLRNEATDFLNFLFSPENYPKLIEYALFDKKAESDEFKNLTRNQINKNAADILSFPSARIKERLGNDENHLLLHKLEEFIRNKELNQNPLYAGHFERIYTNILREPGSHFDTFFNVNIVEILLPLLADNILILPYKEFLTTLLEDLIDQINDDERVDSIIKIILQYASFYSYVMFCKLEDPLNTLATEYRKPRNYFKKFRPLNKDKKHIPIPQFITYEKGLDAKQQYRKEQALKKGRNFFPDKYKDNENFDDYDFRDAEMSAYLFLSIIQTAFAVNNYRYLQNDEFTDMLLFCGVFSSSESLSSMVAFKILENLYYGNLDASFDIQPYQDESFINLIDEYAEFVSYNHETLNLLHVNAFPLFWNHRYKDKRDNTCLIGIDPVLDIKHSTESKKELTPLLILRSFLFVDPPISSRLGFSYLKIFHFLDDKRKKLTGENIKKIQNYPKSIQDKIREIDIIVYEFIQRKFLFYIGENLKYKRLNFYEALNEILPYFPKDSEASPNDSPIRASLNGTAFELCRTFQNSSFFIINNEPSELLIDINNDNFCNKNSNAVIEILQYDSRDIGINKQNKNNDKIPTVDDISDDEDISKEDISEEEEMGISQ